jgi:hypothetical protein
MLRIEVPCSHSYNNEAGAEQDLLQPRCTVPPRGDPVPAGAVGWAGRVFGASVVLGGHKLGMLHVPLGPWHAQEQTHSETSSNYLCTNDELETGGRPSRGCGDSSTEREFPSDKVYRRDDRGVIGIESPRPAQLGLLQRPHHLGREAWPDGSWLSR